MKLLRLAFVAALFGALLVIGCPLDGIGGGKNVSEMDKTPAGWRVDWKDQGTLATGIHTKGEVYALFDAAVIRASAVYQAKYGRPAAEFVAKLKHIQPGFEFRDDFMFPVPGIAADFPGAAYASGMTQGPSVILAFWVKASDPTAADPTAPIWTVRRGASGTWYWAVEPAGAQFPALEYETFVNLMGMRW